MRRPISGLTRAMTGLERADSLDPAADRLRSAVRSTIRPQVVRDALHGTWLGHPLHPVLMHLPIGTFLSAAVLDVLPGQRPGATTLIGVGLAGTLPTAAAGLMDWSTLDREQRRVGLVHAAVNSMALGCYAGSLAARLAGRATAGKALAYAGLSLLGAGAYLGGHLTYELGARVSQPAEAPRVVAATP